MARGEDVTVREFSHNLAGQRVGWVTAQEDPEPDFSDLVHVTVAIGTVGVEGAKCTYVEMESGRGHHRDSSPGISNAFSVGAIVSRQGGIHPSNFSSGRQPRGERAGGLMVTGASLRPESTAEENKRWADGPSELAEALHSAMDSSGVALHYPSLYYLMNGAMCHNGILKVCAQPPEYNPGPLLIADPEMAEETQKQAKLAEQLTEELRAGIAEDKSMMGRLTIFLDKPACEIPEVFVASRRKMEECEANLAKLAEQLIVSGHVYLPAGFRPSGRSYPYMGAHPGDDERNFGQELVALKNKDVGPADYQLGAEVKELKARLELLQANLKELRLYSVSSRRGIGV